MPHPSCYAQSCHAHTLHPHAQNLPLPILFLHNNYCPLRSLIFKGKKRDPLPNFWNKLPWSFSRIRILPNCHWFLTCRHIITHRQGLEVPIKIMNFFSLYTHQQHWFFNSPFLLLLGVRLRRFLTKVRLFFLMLTLILTLFDKDKLFFFTWSDAELEMLNGSTRLTRKFIRLGSQYSWPEKIWVFLARTVRPTAR